MCFFLQTFLIKHNPLFFTKPCQITNFFQHFARSVIQVRMDQGLVVKMNHEVLITRRQSIFIFLQIQAEVGLSIQ